MVKFSFYKKKNLIRQIRSRKFSEKKTFCRNKMKRFKDFESKYILQFEILNSESKKLKKNLRKNLATNLASEAVFARIFSNARCITE